MNNSLAGAVATIPDVCPYCGVDAISGSRCLQCRGLTDPLSLQASQNEMGPWAIRSEKGQFLPGCSYHLIVQQIAKGRITLNSVLRGPTTRQFWMRAARIPAVSHLLGVCHSCGVGVSPHAQSCPNCHASFTFDLSRQSLGLGPVFLVPGQKLENEAVVSGMKLPSVLADSVDFEPLFLEDEPQGQQAMSVEKERVSQTIDRPRSNMSKLSVVIAVWAVLTTGLAAAIAADSWLNLGWGLAKITAAK